MYWEGANLTVLEHSYFVPGDIMFFIFLLSYILYGNIKEEQHIYVQIESCDNLQC
jgi:hypothetical protein